MAPATRIQAVYDPKTKQHKTFNVINITDRVLADLEQQKAERQKLKEEIYGKPEVAESMSDTPDSETPDPAVPTDPPQKTDETPEKVEEQNGATTDSKTTDKKPESKPKPKK